MSFDIDWQDLANIQAFLPLRNYAVGVTISQFCCNFLLVDINGSLHQAMTLNCNSKYNWLIMMPLESADVDFYHVTLWSMYIRLCTV